MTESDRLESGVDGSPPATPPPGRTLILGPSNVGKTRATAAALSGWVAEHGTGGVVVFEFAPAVYRDGTLLGGRLSRFVDVPAGVWHGTLAAHAPRAEGADESASVALAEDNARRAAELFAAAPDARAVFVNDVTIPFQHDRLSTDVFERYTADATCVVANAFESDELGTDDPVSTAEREALSALSDWTERVVRLPDECVPWTMTRR